MSKTPRPRRTVRRLTSASLCLAAILSSIPVAGAQEKTPREERSITVTGTGEAAAAPDLAMTQLTVLRTAQTAAAALGEANTAMSAVVDAMKTLGVEPRDLQTTGFQIAPHYRYDNRQDGTQAPPTLVGYDVRNTLSVRIRNLQTVGGILDKAVSLGVNEGNGIQFTIENPAPLRSEARRKAVADARATAEILATAAGVTLGPVVSIDGAFEPMQPIVLPMPRMQMSAMAKSDETVPVETGENSVSASVRMVFSIEGGS